MTVTMPEVDQDAQIIPFVEAKNPDEHKTHIVDFWGNKRRDPANYEGLRRAQDIVDLARLQGLEVIALCGYVWIPKYNPEKHDICPKCVDTFNKTA